MKSNAYIIFREIFYALTCAIVSFIIMELFSPSMVQSYISINLVLILWLIIAIILLVINKNNQNEKRS